MAMKNTYITLVILVVLVVGTVFALGKGKKAEAPVSETAQSDTVIDIATDTKVSSVNDNVVVKDVVTTAVKEFTVTGQNFSFTPAMITVKKGDKVKITFQNVSGFHDFRIDEYGVATKQTKSPATEVLEFTADKAGSFEYYCSVGTHQSMGMKGTLRVE